MARSLRIEYAGAFYHVVARGNRREPIFLDEDDRRFFLECLSEACEMTGWRVHGWVLMSNHYHLMIETPEPNLVFGMGWLQNTYTRRFNTRHHYWGRLFGDRYKAMLVDGGVGYYFATLLDYIHLNPVRAGMIRAGEGNGLLDFPWSSLASGYALPESKRAPWLAVKDGLAASGLPDSALGRRKYVEHLEGRAREEEAERCGVPDLPEDGRLSHLRKGWYWGTQAFAEKMLKLADKPLKRLKSREYRGSELSKRHDERKAEEILCKELRRYRLGMEELESLPGSDWRKIEIAMAIRKQTTVSQEWLAQNLRMRSAANVSQQIRRYKSETSK